MTRDDLKGSSREEEYFYKLNKELIERKRQELEKLEANQAKHLNWMKCPKCPGDMAEVELAGIRVDKCNDCNGIFFDHGELDILIESKEPKGFLGAMKRLFK